MVKPKDFRVPFTRDFAHVELADRVLFIPPQCDLKAFSFPDWNSSNVFGNDNPVHVEFCSGNGTWIIEKALANPQCNWVAAEIRFDRVRKIWSKAKNLNLPNLLIVFGDARTFGKEYVPNSSISALYINFPDPWPKKRHAKHRIISDSFMQDASVMIKPEGKLVFVTDDEDYSNLFLEHAQRCIDRFTPICPEGKMIPPAEYGTSFFEELFRSQGKPILYHELTKNPCAHS